ncbi:replication protein A DNA-binding subunit D [Acrasis kona]|uniref:Replication protein A DNA-binding subunit D n=1 Tax=Acrasis kona TaxID=1008807 RepID=A0AAW2ZHM1_9EUKA
MQSRLKALSHLVILVGPPCSGKTSLYTQQYEPKGYSRVFIQQSEDEDNVNDTLDTLFKSLESGNNVVLDDEQFNIFEIARKKMIEKLLKSIKDLEITVHEVRPVGGKEQCTWAAEFSLAERCLTFDNTDTYFIKPEQNTSERLEYYFDNITSPPQQDDANKLIVTSKNLFINRPLRLAAVNVGLFIDSSCILKNKKKLSIDDENQARSLIMSWYSIYHDARLIIIHRDRSTLPYLKNALRALDIPFPIYYTLFRDWYDVGFLQYTHGLSLQKSIYLHEDDNSAALPPKHILRHLKREDLLDLTSQFQDHHSQQLDPTEQVDTESIHLQMREQIDEVSEYASQEADQEKFSFLSNIEHLSTLKNETLPQVPKYALLYQLTTSDYITDEDHFEINVFGRLHGVFLPRRFIDDFEVESTQAVVMGTAPSSKESVEETRSRYLNKEPLAVIKMTVSDVMNHFGVTYFQRGRDYKDDLRIDKLRIKPLQPSCLVFKLYSTCKGSIEEPYQEESLFKNGKLLKAACTCPIGSGGMCKHVCAQLLAYMVGDSYGQPNQKNKGPPPLVAFHQLDPINSNWCIKGRVINKSAVRNWSNERGSGTVATVLLRDESANKNEINHIRVVMFNESVDEFYDTFTINKIYNISRAHLNIPNPNKNTDDKTRAPSGTESVYEIHLREKISNVGQDNLMSQVPLDTKPQVDQPKNIEEIFESRFNKNVQDEGIAFMSFNNDESSPLCHDVFVKDEPVIIKQSPKRLREEQSVSSFPLIEDNDDEDDSLSDLFFNRRKTSPSPKKKQKISNVDSFDEIMNLQQDSQQQHEMEVHVKEQTKLKEEKPIEEKKKVVYSIEDDDDDDDVQLVENAMVTPKKRSSPKVNLVDKYIPEVSSAPTPTTTPLKTPKKISLKMLIEQSNKMY